MRGTEEESLEKPPRSHALLDADANPNGRYVVKLTGTFIVSLVGDIMQTD